MTPNILASRAHATQQVLEALLRGPQRNVKLAEISPTVNDHIGFLRNEGFVIECAKSGERGIFIYTLYNTPQPKWDISVDVTLHDSTTSVQHLVVDAMTVRQAKSIARNFAAHTKIRKCAMRAGTAVTGNEMATDDGYHPVMVESSIPSPRV